VSTTTVAVESLDQGAHACSVLDSDRGARAVLRTYIRQGLQSDRRVICFLEPRTIRSLFDGPGAALVEAARRGQLLVRDSAEVYLDGGPIDPDRMLSALSRTVDDALGDGFAGVSIAEDVNWPGQMSGVERLVEYERQVDEVLAERPAHALCLYDWRRLPDDLLDEALATHRYVAGKLPVPSPSRFRVLPQPDGSFRLAGELDIAEADLLAEVLDRSSSGADQVDLDLGDLRFIDVAGMRALCRPALRGTARVVLHRPGRLVRKVLELLDVEGIPGVLVHDTEDG
jgi:anti-anti-sigma factor